MQLKQITDKDFTLTLTFEEYQALQQYETNYNLCVTTEYLLHSLLQKHINKELFDRKKV